MSSRISKARIASFALAAIAVTTVLTAAIVGWTGLPQERAFAATTSVGTAASSHARFATVVASAVPLSARTRLVAPVRPQPAVRRNVRTLRTVRTAPWKEARVSWYGPGFYGNTMAGGGRLRRTSMVVAHRSMKFGTRILLNYKGKTVIAVVRDRGPYVSGRTFDLGPGTAKSLGFNGVGTVKYRVL